MILSNATNISDIKLAGSSICGALQNSTQAIFWGYGSTTVSRILSGSIALYKYGAGTVTLSVANSYTNGTFLAEGTVILSNSAGIGTSGNITFTGGGLRYLSGVTRDIASRIKNSTSPVTITIDSSASQSWSGVMDSSNTGGFTKRGTGNLTLTSSHTLTGPLTLREGNVYFQQPNVFSEVRLVRGTGLGINLGSTNRANGFGTGTIYFELESGPAFPDSLSWDSSSLSVGPMVVTNPISVNLNKGRGQLIFYGTKGFNFTGNITITGTGNSASAATTTTTTNSNQLVFASVPSFFAVGMLISGTGIPPFTEITQISGNTITISTTVSISSGTAINAGSGDFVITNSQTGGSLLTYSGAITGTTMSGSFSLRGSNVGNNGVFSGSLNAPSAGLAHNGVNWWTLFANASNNYSRLVLQNAASNAGIIFGDNNCIPSTVLIQWGTLSASSVDMNGKNATCAGLLGAGLGGTSAANLINVLTNSSATTCTLTIAGLVITRFYYGTISGPINIVLNSTGRTQGLYGSNGHTGSTTITAGTLIVGRILSGTANKFSTATFTPTTLAASFSVAPVSTDTFRLFGGTTTNTYASVSLTGGGGQTGYYNSSTSTLGFVPAPTGASTDVPTVGSDTMIIPVSANPNGTQAGSSASVLIEYGTSPSLGLTSTPVTIGTGTTSVLSTHQLSALSSDTLYYYRARVSNVLWTVYSSTQSATTAPLGDQYFNNTFYLQTFDGLTEAQAYDNSNQAGYAALKDITSVYGAGTRTVSSSVAKSGNGANLPQPAVGYSTGINAQFPNTVVGRYWQPMIAWEFTIEASIYVNPAVIGSVSLPFYGGFRFGSSLTSVYYRLDTANSAYLQISTVVDASGGPQNVQNVNIPLSGWYDIAITRDKNLTVRYFLNGSLIHTVQQSRYTGYDYSGELSETLGGVNTGYHTNPNNLLYVDDVRVSNVCRYTQNYTPVHPLPTVAKVGADPYLNNIIFLQDFSSTASGAILSDPLANLSSSGLSYTTSGMNMYRDQYSADFGPSLGTAYVVQDGNPTFAKRMVAWPSPDGAESRVYSVSSTARTTTATTTNSTVLSFSSAINYAAWQIGCVVLGPGIPFNTTIVDRSEDLSSVTLSTAVTVPSGTVLYGSMNKTPTINTTISGNFTIEVSTKAAAYSSHNNARILSLFAASGEEIGSIGLVGSSGVPQLFLEGTNTTPALGSAALGLVWTDWAISWDGTSLRFFQNGKLIHTGSKTKTVASIGTPWIVPILDAIWVPAQNGQPGYYYSNMYTIIWSKLRITNACRYTADYNPVYPWPTT